MVSRQQDVKDEKEKRRDREGGRRSKQSKEKQGEGTRLRQKGNRGEGEGQLERRERQGGRQNYGARVRLWKTTVRPSIGKRDRWSPGKNSLSVLPQPCSVSSHSTSLRISSFAHQSAQRSCRKTDIPSSCARIDIWFLKKDILFF